MIKILTKEEVKEFLNSKFKDDYKRTYQILKFQFQNYFEAVFYHTSFLSKNVAFKERIYCILYEINKVKFCKLCSNLVVFKSIKEGYSLYCSKCYRKNPMSRKKIKDSNIKTYKNKKTEINIKRDKTNLRRYGTVEPNELPSMKEKIKKITLEKYGVEYNQLNEEVQEKTQQTNLRKRKVRFSFQAEEVKNKSKKTNIKRYGGPYAFLNKEIREKAKQTLLNRYGVDNISKVKSVMEQISNMNRINFLKRFYIILNKMKFELVDEIYKNNITKHKWKCLICNKTFIETWRNMCRGFRCIYCFPRNSISSQEIEISDYLKSLKLDLETNIRNIIPPKELDIYIPSKNIAIEFNGLWWHSEEAGCNKDYHIQKTIACEEKGISLIHIFEDEWMLKNKIVKYRLKQILGKSNAKRIYARNCEIKEISAADKNSFLDEFHLQGKDKSVIKLGAFYLDELISVMTFSKGSIAKGSRKKDNVWELNRFCSNYNYHIPGIAGKLLAHFTRNFKWIEIFSYADYRWSKGNLYYKLGFDLHHITRPNYWYVKNYKRIHRFNLRKRATEPKEISESKLRTKEGYIKIWDCGSLKFILENK